jgi:trigger factor
MQISQAVQDGLKRTMTITVPAAEISQRFEARLDDLKDKVQLKGFRKGKVPTVHLKKMYGRSVMGEVLDEAIKDTSLKAIEERKERPAMQPDIQLPEDPAVIAQVIDGKADLSYSMSFEVLPKVEVMDLKGLKLERIIADVDPADIDGAIEKLVDRSVGYEAADGRAASDGDQVTLDFAGKIDGELFEGGAAEGAQLVLGQGQFIPGFEDGLKGAVAGDKRAITATFPDTYPVPTLAGKTAVFDVIVKAVATPNRPVVDDAFAASLGAENMDDLRRLVTEQLQKELDGASRMKLKRELLDALEKAHGFELPGSLVEHEFNSIWTQLTNTMKQQNQAFSDEAGKTEDDAKVEYRKIAERRVRLGLLVGEIGDKNKIEVTQDELRRALIEQARQFPGQEKMVYEYYEKTPGAVAELRAPIFEDKVVDYVLAQASPGTRKVSKDELFKMAEDVSQS